MKLSAHFYLLNDDFSQEHADAVHSGHESENNRRFEWEDELEVSDLHSVEIERNSSFEIQACLPTDEIINSTLTKMFCIKLLTSNGQTGYMGISESLLDSYEESGNEEHRTIRVYMKDYEPHGNPMPGIYIASKEFPKELVF